MPEGCAALLGINLPSTKMGRKDILKLEGVRVRPSKIEALALFGRHATVAEISEYRVVRKTEVALPAELSGIVRCRNPGCITNHNRITTRFRVEAGPRTLLRCGYCERGLTRDEIEFTDGGGGSTVVRPG